MCRSPPGQINGAGSEADRFNISFFKTFVIRITATASQTQRKAAAHVDELVGGWSRIRIGITNRGFRVSCGWVDGTLLAFCLFGSVIMCFWNRNSPRLCETQRRSAKRRGEDSDRFVWSEGVKENIPRNEAVVLRVGCVW